jgi:hypothetical protein
MSLNYVEVTGTIVGGAGCKIEFDPSNWRADPADHLMIPPVGVTVTADSNGSFTTELLATDNTITPGNWHWTVSISGGANVGFESWSFFLPYASGATQDLSELAPITPTRGMGGYLLLSGGTLTGPLFLAADPAEASQAATKNYVDEHAGVPATGGTFTGPLVVNDVPSGAPSGLPVGYGNSEALTGLQIASSYPSDDVEDGTDGTGRINLYSYQRANTYSFGETIRNFLMRRDAKAMTAWYSAVNTADSTDGYDNTTRYPNASGITWTPVVWTGAHDEANDHGSLHMHWEVEAADALGELQGRLTILYGDPTTAVVGINKTIIGTNAADFHFQAYGSYSDGSSAQQYFRIMAAAGYEKAIEWNVAGVGTIDPTAYRRWKLFATSDAETGSNAGTNFALNYYDDSGNLLGTPIRITRSTGQILLGGSSYASPVLIESNSGVALQVTPLNTGGQAILVTGTDTTARAYESNVSGDAAQRFVTLVDGSMTWGNGTNSRDTNLYRSATGLLKTDDSLEVAGKLAVGAAPGSLAFAVSSSATGQLAQFTRSSTSDTSPVVVVLAGDTSTAQALGISVSGDSTNRFGIDPTGKVSRGTGSAARDTDLYRSGLGYLSTDGYLSVAKNFVIGSQGNSLSSGLAGGIAMANAATAPAATPSGGGVLYVSAGALLYKGSSGTVTTIASA